MHKYVTYGICSSVNRTTYTTFQTEDISMKPHEYNGFNLAHTSWESRQGEATEREGSLCELSLGARALAGIEISGWGRGLSMTTGRAHALLD